MKRRRQSKPISNINGLPEHLATEILTHLPIQDAVKTSVVAKNMRYAWTELPKLVFDDLFCEESIMNSQSKLLMAIYQVLLIHRGPLHEFTLSLSNLESCSGMDQFVLVVLRKGVKNFTLHMLKGDPYRLPTSIFAHDQQLELLNLYSCVFKPPPRFKGFSKLTDLSLDEVVGISDNKVSSLISNCPLLESFYFKSSTTCTRLDIANPNLKSLIFECLCESICFKNNPKLANVEVYILNSAEVDALNINGASSKFMLCGKLPAVEVLQLSYLYSRNTTANKTPRSIVNDLCHLKALGLWNMCFGALDEVFSALCFIRHCQRLEKLTITFDNLHFNVPDPELSEVEGFPDVTLDYLKKVELIDVTGSKCELQLIELILARSPVLENFYMKTVPVLVGEKGFRFFKELSTYHRASPLVKFVYE